MDRPLAEAITRGALYKEAVLKNFAIIIGKHLWWSLFDEVAALKTCNFIEKGLQHKCFLVIIIKFLRASILKNI